MSWQSWASPSSQVKRPMRMIIAHKSRRILGVLMFFLCIESAAHISAQEATLSSEEIIHRIDAAVRMRSESISAYTVHEHYSVYRNGEANPSAEETVRTEYTRATGKHYIPVSQSGSSLIRSAVIGKVLAGEEELNRPANRDSILITSANYEMHPHPDRVELNGHTCVIVDLKPLRKSPHLFDGKVWIDASDFTIVRLEGTPSQTPSWLVSQSGVSRDYAKVEGFAMAIHAEARAHSFLFGDTLLKIEYTDYNIQLEPGKAAPTHASTD